MKTILMILSLLFPLFLRSADHPQLKAFPPAKEGMSRAVIVVPPLDNEEDHLVELIVGEVKMTDGVNPRRMAGGVKAEPLQGWGYTYYVARRAPVMSTLMAPPPGGEQVERFVAMPGKRVRYNSKLPIVIYVSEGLEVRYRVWSAGEERAAE